MQQSSLVLARRVRSRVLWLAVLGAWLTLCELCVASDEARPAPLRASTPSGFHSDGVFDESYFRQLRQPMESSIMLGRLPRANGGYSYGFPMQSYRWSYFGAERRSPRVMWHQGYYGDKVRAAYRHEH